MIAVEVRVAQRVDEVPGRQAGLLGHDPVSYTHLTLPTSDLV